MRTGAYRPCFGCLGHREPIGGPLCGSVKPEGIEGPFIAASAGNHAQGVAFGAKSLGLKAYIVMPITTPSIKVNSVKNYGGKVILHGDNFDEAFKRTAEEFPMKKFNVYRTAGGHETDQGRIGAFRGGKSEDGRDPSGLSGYEEQGDKSKPMMFALK